MEQLGAPSVHYTFNQPELGQTPEGFDCSGFITFVLAQAGIELAQYVGRDGTSRPIRHASEYWDHYGVLVHPGLHRAGDLIVFSKKGLFPTHIGIVIEPEKYIHAPGKNNTEVAIEPIKTEAIPKLITDRRQLYSLNPIGFKAVTSAASAPNYRYHQELPD